MDGVRDAVPTGRRDGDLGRRTWTHLAGAYEAGRHELRIYVDGGTGRPGHHGRQRARGDALDDARISDKALNAGQLIGVNVGDDGRISAHRNERPESAWDPAPHTVGLGWATSRYRIPETRIAR